jgi:hypothetical protein
MANIHKPPLKKATIGKAVLKTTHKIVSPRVSSLEVESPQLCSTPLTVSSRSLTEFLSASFPSLMSAVSKSLSAPSTISNVNKRFVFDDVDHQAKTKPKKQEPKFTPLTVSSCSSMEFLSMSSPSSMSVVLKSSSVPSTISNVNKRLVLDDVDHHAKTKLKKQEPKLAAYDIDWFDSSALKNECLKYTHITLDLVIYKIIYERERRELYLFYAQIRPGGTMIPVRAS